MIDRFGGPLPVKLTQSQQNVLTMMACKGGRSGDRAFPSVRSICEVLHMGERTARRALSVLRGHGLIERVEVFDTGVVRYRVCIPKPKPKNKVIRFPKVVQAPSPPPPAPPENLAPPPAILAPPPAKMAPHVKEIERNLKTSPSVCVGTNEHRGGATLKQLAYLRSMACQLKKPVPVHLTHSRASELIDEWKAQIGPPKDRHTLRSEASLAAGRAWLARKDEENEETPAESRPPEKKVDASDCKAFFREQEKPDPPDRAVTRSGIARVMRVLNQGAETVRRGPWDPESG